MCKGNFVGFIGRGFLVRPNILSLLKKGNSVILKILSRALKEKKKSNKNM